MEPIQDAERTAIVAEWTRQAAAARPRALRPLGCGAAAAAVLGIAALPFLIRAGGLALPPLAGVAVLLALAALLVGGMLHSSRPGRLTRALASVRASEAMDRLTTRYAADDPDSRRRAAVTLLVNAWYDDGAGPGRSYDAAACGVRLVEGGQLEYVRAVERVVRELGAAPVFT